MPVLLGDNYLLPLLNNVAICATVCI